MWSLSLWLVTDWVIACHLTLSPSLSEDTNIWAILAATDLVQSPFVLCLADSDSQHRFTLDDTLTGCFWTAPDLTIQ